MSTAKDIHDFQAEAMTVATDQPFLWLSIENRRPGHVRALAARPAR